MTRAECEETVSYPGKFERCAPYVPYFWDQYLNGMADNDDGTVLTFLPTPEDIALFPELADTLAIYLMEDDNGFVNEIAAPDKYEDVTEEGEEALESGLCANCQNETDEDGVCTFCE